MQGASIGGLGNRCSNGGKMAKTEYLIELTGDELEAILKGLACYQHECLASSEYVYRDRIAKIQRLSDRLEGEKP